MRKILFYALILSFFTSHSQQVKNELTTQEIYNYITKGYITTLQQGLDIKKGYAYTEIKTGTVFSGSLSGSKYRFAYRAFHRESDKSHVIAFMIVLLKDEAVEKVFCLPSWGSDISFYSSFYSDVDARLYNDQKNVLYRELAMLFTIMMQTCEKSLSK